MIVSITKIELRSYSMLVPFIKFNRQIIEELKQSRCEKFKVTGSWNFKVWYTMSLWKEENDINEFYRNGTHLAAMKRSKEFSSKINSIRIEGDTLIGWSEAKKLFS